MSVSPSKVPEGHHPRGKTLREALRGNLPLALCGSPSEGSAGSLSEGSAGSLQERIFQGFSGVVTLCL